MAKHHDKEDGNGEGVKLVGSLDDIVNLIITNHEEREWAIDKLTNKGPKHEQVLTALLLRRLYELIQTIEKKNGKAFFLQAGCELSKNHEDHIKVLPVKIPVNPGTNTDRQNIADAIAHAPAHKLLAYALYLQVIEWAIKTAK